MRTAAVSLMYGRHHRWRRCRSRHHNSQSSDFRLHFHAKLILFCALNAPSRISLPASNRQMFEKYNYSKLSVETDVFTIEAFPFYVCTCVFFFTHARWYANIDDDAMNTKCLPLNGSWVPQMKLSMPWTNESNFHEENNRHVFNLPWPVSWSMVDLLTLRITNRYPSNKKRCTNYQLREKKRERFRWITLL